MRALGGIVLTLALALAGCASVQPRPCPTGQERLRTAQLFFAPNTDGKPRVSDADFRKYADEELTPRFPDGLTILNGGGQWRGSENQRLIPLTDRYTRALAEPDTTAGIELSLDADGSLSWAGVPPTPGFREGLEKQLAARGFVLHT